MKYVGNQTLYMDSSDTNVKMNNNLQYTFKKSQDLLNLNMNSNQENTNKNPNHDSFSNKLNSSKSQHTLTNFKNFQSRTDRISSKTLQNNSDNFKSLPDINSKFIKSSQVIKEVKDERQDWFEYKSKLAKSKPNLSNFLSSTTQINKESGSSSIVNFVDAIHFNMPNNNNNNKNNNRNLNINDNPPTISCSNGNGSKIHFNVNNLVTDFKSLDSNKLK